MLKSLHPGKILCAIIIILQSGWLHAQNPAISETVSNAFENSNGNDTYLSPHSVIGNDGSINVITTYFGTYDMAIIKYSPDGEVLNQILIKNMVPITSTSFINPQKYLLMDDDDNYYILGYHGSSDQSLEIQKISASGSWLWTYDYPQFPVNNISYARSNAFAMDHDGNIITAGISVSTTGHLSNFAIKLSPEGQPIWSKTSIVPGYGYSNYFRIIVDDNNDIYMGGDAGNENSANSYFLAQKFTGDGNPVWTNVFVTGGSNASAIVLDMVLAPSGNLYATGYKSSKMFTIKYDLSGNTTWSKDYAGAGTSSTAEYSHAIFLDTDENVYIAGESDQPVTGLDLTAIKYNKNGIMQWATSYPFNLQTNFFNEYFAGAALDANNNLVLSGVANDTAGSPFSSYLKELYLRFDADGNIVYSELHRAGEAVNQNPGDLIMDPSGNTYVVGSTKNSFNHLPALYLLKRNSNDGALYELQYQVPLSGKEFHKSALVDKSGNFYSANNITDQGDHPKQSYRYDANGNQTLVNSYNDGNLNRMVRDQPGRILICGTSGNDPNLILCDSGGSQLWSRTLSDRGYATDIVSDVTGNIYVTGYYAPKNDSTDIFVVKYDALGTKLWSITYNGAGLANDEAYAMCIDDASNIFITGRTQSGVTYYPLLLKYDANGNLLWSLIPPSVALSRDFGYDVLADNTGGCFVTGRFTQSQLTQQGFVVIKVSTSGAILKKLFRTGTDQSSTDFGTHLFLDVNSNLYAEGRVMKNGKPYAISVMKLKSNLKLKWLYEKSGYNYGPDDSIGAKISYNDPFQFAVDSKGNVYVANVLNDSYNVKIAMLNKYGTQQWTYTSTVNEPKLNPSPDMVCDDQDNVWCVFNVFSEGLTAYDWRILKFSGSPSPMRIEQTSYKPVSELQTNLSLIVYPNPMQEVATIYLPIVSPGKITVTIRNLLQEIVYYSEENCEQTSYEKTISLKNLSPGIYSIDADMNDEHATTTLIKQ